MMNAATNEDVGTKEEMGTKDVLSPVVIEDPDALEGLASVWNQLWESTRPLPPMLEFRWVDTWWRIHRRNRRLLLILAVDDALRPVGLAPLCVRRDLGQSGGMLRTITFLGTGEREADEVASEYLGWLAPPERIAAVHECVGRVLCQRRQSWDRVHLVNIGPDQDLPERMREALGPVTREASVRARPSFRIAACPSEEFIARLSSGNFRHRCRRALRAGVEAGVELVTAREPEEVSSLFQALTALHQKRWQARGRPGVFDSAVFSRFHSRLLPAYVADGTAWLVGLRQQGRWLAARYHLRAGNRVFDYVSGIDPETSPALGPGLLLTLHALDWCVAHGVSTYDLLAGDYDYKRKLATDEGELYDLDLFGSSLAAQVWLAARKLGARLRAA
jgi:CelD/BcsL family acetyltransferase involved in cellulose biosynthesis